jgi:hypothetical protein
MTRVVCVWNPGVQQELLRREPRDNVKHSCPADWAAVFEVDSRATERF